MGELYSCYQGAAEAPRAIGLIALRDGVIQMVHSKVINCGSDGVAALDGGVVALNQTLVSRNEDNGVLVQGEGSTDKVRETEKVRERERRIKR